MQTIGRYQLQEKLGQGGMGVVYRAFDSLIERVVAIKVISSPIEPNPEMRERFFREARAAGQLSHKNIITIHDLGEHEGQPYLAMEYLDGEDLQRRLRRPEKMSLSRKLDLAIDICEGLEYAHSRGVVHRDVKPANIFITERGHRQGPRLRPRAARDVAAHQHEHVDGHAELHGARAGPRRACRSSVRHLLGRRGHLRAAVRQKGVRRGFVRVHALQDPAGSAGAALEDRSTLPRELVAIVERALAKPKDERYQQMRICAPTSSTYRQILHADSIVTGPMSVPSRPSSDAKRLSAVDADLTQPVDAALTPPSGGPGSGGPGSGGPGSGGPGTGRPGTAGPGTPGPGTPAPGTGGPGSGGPALAVPGSGGVPSTASMPAPSRLPLIATIGVAALAIVVVWMWIAQRRPAPQPPPTTAAVPEAPVDPTVAALRQARASLEAKDYASAQQFAEAILVTAPDQAEARQIRDTARDQQVQAALRTAQEHLAAGDFAEASRAAGTVLALDPGNAEAKRITEQGSVRERTRAADEGRTRMNEARASALAAGATRLAPAAFRAATRVDQDAQRLYKTGRLSEAMSRFYEASGLYRSAETTANSEAALQRSLRRRPTPRPRRHPHRRRSIPPPSTSPAVPAPTVEAPPETAKPQVTAPVTPAPPPAAKPPEPLPPPPAAPAPSTRPLPSPPVRNRSTCPRVRPPPKSGFRSC